MSRKNWSIHCKYNKLIKKLTKKGKNALRRLFKLIAVIYLLFEANFCLAADWRFLANSESKIDGPSVIFIDLSDIKNINSKFRLWIQIVSEKELDQQSSKLTSLIDEINEISGNGYISIGYSANPELFAKHIDQQVRHDSGLGYEDVKVRKSMSDTVRELWVRLAIRSELIAKKSNLNPSGRICYEIDIKENTAQVLQYLDKNGLSDDAAYKKSFIPPESPLETMVKLVKQIAKQSPQKERLKNSKSYI